MPKEFPLHTVETAPEEVRPVLEATIARIGFLPTMYAKWAEAPVLLQAYRATSGFFEKSSFSAAEQLVVLMTASFVNNCDFCMSAHSWSGSREGVDRNIIAALRDGGPLADPKLEALRAFVRKLVLSRGALAPEDREAFFAAGYSPRQALEAVLGVAMKVMTNYTNSLARTHPNEEFGAYLWRPSGVDHAN
jgi:AhpD family alkylhydroperoxidase